MQIIKEGTYYVARCPFEEKDIAKAAGFRWNPDNRHWWTPSKANAAKLAEYADDALRAELEPDHKAYVSNMELSRGTDADIEIPCPEGLKPMPFQKAGVAYALNRFGTLIADDMGLGKTIQALSVINCLDWIKRVLIICPASLKLNWKREAEKWLVRPATIGICVSKMPFRDTDIVIANYDIVHKYRDEMRAFEWDLLICDEAHYMKAGRNIRSVNVLGGKLKRATGTVTFEPIPAKKIIFMTGSPIENGKPIELYPLIHRLDPETWKSWGYYTKRYCGAYKGRWGWDVSGAANLEELQQKLRESVMVRRMKSQVLTELPPKQRQVIELSPNGSSGCIKREQEAYSRHEAKLEQLRIDVELAKAEDKEQYEAAVARLKEGASAALTEISRLRHETALAKLPAVLDFLEGRSGKIVIFAHHRDVIEKLKEHFGNTAVVLYGGMSPEKKQEAVDKFQTDPSVEVFLGGIKAAGVGLTLTASSHVVFVELDWVPGVVSQAEDRCHRIGQTDSVLVQHLVYEGSLDAKMVQTLVKKQQLIDAALDNNPPDIPVTAGPEAATSRLTWSQVNEPVNIPSYEQITAIHEGLQRLAMSCDGARAEDGMGFNRLDTRIGKSLAAVPTLTHPQALLGRRLCIKYQGQLGPHLTAIIKGE